MLRETIADEHNLTLSKRSLDLVGVQTPKGACSAGRLCEEGLAVAKWGPIQPKQISLCQGLLYGRYPLDTPKQSLLLHTYIRHLAPSKPLMIERNAINLIWRILKEQSLH